MTGQDLGKFVRNIFVDDEGVGAGAGEKTRNAWSGEFRRRTYTSSRTSLLRHEDNANLPHADLSRVGESAKHDSVCSGFEVGVLENNHRGLASEFQDHWLDVATAELCDLGSDKGGAGEVDLSHGRVSNDGFARCWCILGCHMDYVQDAFGQACVDEELGGEGVDLW